MPAVKPGPATSAPTSSRRGRWLNIALALVVVALFAIPLGLRLNAADAPEGEAYAGTDSTATDVVAEIDPGYEPWFSPWFEPSSGEIESGLFALQAALGAGVFGFAIGRLSGRRAATAEAAARQASGPNPPDAPSSGDANET